MRKTCVGFRPAMLLFAGLLLSVASGSVAPVWAQTVSVSTRQAITKRYAGYDRLDAGKDTQSFLLWYLENTTGDYTERQYGGRTATRAQVIGAIRSVAAQTRNRPSGVHLRSATVVQKLVRGTGASAVASTRVTVVAKTPPAKGRAAATVSTVETHRDTWVRAAGQWHMKRREVLTHSSSVNGKPVR